MWNGRMRNKLLSRSISHLKRSFLAPEASHQEMVEDEDVQGVFKKSLKMLKSSKLDKLGFRSLLSRSKMV